MLRQRKEKGVFQTRGKKPGRLRCPWTSSSALPLSLPMREARKDSVRGKGESERTGPQQKARMMMKRGSWWGHGTSARRPPRKRNKRREKKEEREA